MIDISIVRKIIEDNLIVMDETKNKKLNKTGAMAKDLAWTPSRIALKDYIVKLPYEGIIDLCALMAYGRDKYLNPAIKCGSQEYEQRREDYSAGGKMKTNEDYAVNLLHEGFKLSEYLNWALELYQNKS